MTMTLNNSASMVALGNLNKNVKKVGATLAKIASGDRIPTAKYDSAGLAMSEILREQLRSLHQDQQNVQNGSSLFKTAAGGIDDIISNIRRLKELAINSANDSNSDIDRATIQKEVDASLATIEDIAVGTEYNGRKLLDGTLAKRLIEESQNTYPDAIVLTASDFSNGVFTITDPDKVYKFDSSMDSGRYTVNVATSNVKFVGGGGAVSPDVSIVMQNGGDLYIENLDLTAHSDRNLIDFQGSSNNLHFAGNNKLDHVGTYSNGGSLKAVVRAGGDLTISGEETSGTKGKLTVNQAAYAWGACIGTDGVDNPNASNITILSGTLKLNSQGSSGAALGAGCNWHGAVGDITINDGKIDITCDQRAITVGADGGSTTAGKIIINGGTINAVANDYLGNAGDTSAARSDYIFGASGNNSGSVADIQFNGGAIYIENKGSGKALPRGFSGVPTEGFSNGDKIYSLQLDPPYTDEDDKPSYEKNFAIHHGTGSNQMDLFSI